MVVGTDDLVPDVRCVAVGNQWRFRGHFRGVRVFGEHVLVCSAQNSSNTGELVVVCDDEWSALCCCRWSWCKKLFTVHASHFFSCLPHLAFLVSAFDKEINELF